MTRKIDPALIPTMPTLEFENALYLAGCRWVAGVDEAGRGCLAGPVLAAVVILPRDRRSLQAISGVQDSKQLAPQIRENLRQEIEAHSQAYALGSASNWEVDEYGIVPATRLAIQRALENLPVVPDHLLVDYLVLPEISLTQTRLVKGDARSQSIAAASILAKTYRDDLMIKMADLYPQYGFDQNKGYGTQQHRRALQESGPCALHRRSFAPIRNEGSFP